MSIIEQANRIPFHNILKGLQDKTMQIHCPFAKERHGGSDVHRSARYYPDTNRIYCFTCVKSWTPVLLIAEKLGVNSKKAAQVLVNKMASMDVTVKKQVNISRLHHVLAKKVDLQLDSFDALSAVSPYRSVSFFIGAMRYEAELWGLELFNMTMQTAQDMEEFLKEQNVPPDFEGGYDQDIPPVLFSNGTKA